MMSSPQQEYLPVQIARCHHHTKHQNKRQWAPLTQALDRENEESAGKAAALSLMTSTLSQLLDSIKLRQLSASIHQIPGIPYLSSGEEGLESLPLSKMILYREEVKGGSSAPTDEAESRDQVESALTRTRPGDPGVLKLLETSLLLREKVQQL